MAVAQVNYYKSCGLHLIRDTHELRTYVRGWRKGTDRRGPAHGRRRPDRDPIAAGRVDRYGRAHHRTRVEPHPLQRRHGRPGRADRPGRAAVEAMRRKHVILDLSHMADQAVADAFEMWRGPIVCSHSNARAIVPRRPADHGCDRGRGRASRRHPRHQLLSDSSAEAGPDNSGRRGPARSSPRARGRRPEHVGLGTDLDGGIDSRYGPIHDLGELKKFLARPSAPLFRRDSGRGHQWARIGSIFWVDRCRHLKRVDERLRADESEAHGRVR